MSRRNVANYTTFNSILVNYLEIQNSGPGLIIYDTDRLNPIFSLDTSTQEININGNLNVSGESIFNNILVTDFRRDFKVDNTTNIMLDENYSALEVSNTGSVIITLPNITSLHRGREYHIIKTGSTGTVTINTFGSNNYIDNNTTTTFTLSVQFDRVTLLCNGVNRWYTM
jgi:hypothetical protein